MLTLLLLRHAKAEASGRGDDASRRLTTKGEGDAASVGRFLAGHQLVPTMALVSSARRTEQTFDLVSACFDSAVATERDDALYNADGIHLLARIARLPSSVATVLVVAHNPGIMDAAVVLARQGDLSEVERLRGRFPPGGLAVLGFDAEDWADACAGGGRLDALMFPEDVGA